jgi:hypothetical protein
MSKKIQDQEIIEHLANSYLKVKTQEGDCTLRLAELVDEATSRLRGNALKVWFKDSRVNLKATQARKLKSVYHYSKTNAQSTELFQNEGIEKTFILSKLEDSQLRDELTNFLLKTTLSSRDLTKLIQIISSDKLEIEVAFEKLQELKQLPKEKAKDEVVSSAEFLKLQRELEDFKKRYEASEKELMQYKQNSLKNSPPNLIQIKAKQESDHEQASFFSIVS